MAVKANPTAGSVIPIEMMSTPRIIRTQTDDCIRWRCVSNQSPVR